MYQRGHASARDKPAIVSPHAEQAAALVCRQASVCSLLLDRQVTWQRHAGRGNQVDSDDLWGGSDLPWPTRERPLRPASICML